MCAFACQGAEPKSRSGKRGSGLTPRKGLTPCHVYPDGFFAFSVTATRSRLTATAGNLCRTDAGMPLVIVVDLSVRDHETQLGKGTTRWG